MTGLALSLSEPALLGLLLDDVDCPLDFFFLGQGVYIEIISTQINDIKIQKNNGDNDNDATTYVTTINKA